VDNHTSQQEFAIWQPAWPTVDGKVSLELESRCGQMINRIHCLARVEKHTVQADDFSHDGRLILLVTTEEEMMSSAGRILMEHKVKRGDEAWKLRLWMRR
jgi:hypothetical protein